MTGYTGSTTGEPHTSNRVYTHFCLRMQEMGTNTATIKALQTTATQIGRLIARIANRHHGLKVGLRLVHAFIISKITYVIPYLKFTRMGKEKVERIIHKAIKLAVGIPVSASTERLMEMGVHNTLDELFEAQRTAQYSIPAGSPTGRAILDSLHICYADLHGRKIFLDDDFRAHVSEAALPKYMHPEHHQERRLTRAMALHKQYHSN